ncbi:hypothetical protein GCM10010378_65350 [Streptomyces viridochromogenes]
MPIAYSEVTIPASLRAARALPTRAAIRARTALNIRNPRKVRFR